LSVVKAGKSLATNGGSFRVLRDADEQVERARDGLPVRVGEIALERELGLDPAWGEDRGDDGERVARRPVQRRDRVGRALLRRAAGE
jgi:hypothetical protein